MQYIKCHRNSNPKILICCTISNRDLVRLLLMQAYHAGVNSRPPGKGTADAANYNLQRHRTTHCENPILRQADGAGRGYVRPLRRCARGASRPAGHHRICQWIADLQPKHRRVGECRRIRGDLGFGRHHLLVYRTYQNFGFGGNYGDYTPTQPGNAKFTLLGQLFHEAYGQATIDEAHSAAFQLEIWEIVYDSGNLNLGGGTFQVLNNYGHAATVALAQSWLTNLSNITDNYDLIMLSSPSRRIS